MPNSATHVLDYLIPTQADITLAKIAEATLSRVKPKRGVNSVPLAAGTTLQAPVSVPARAYALLIELLHELGQGRTVALSVVDEELTTHQAADLLGVSRPFLIGLLDRGDIPHRRVGTHRRMRTTDVLAYQRRIREQRMKILRELTAENDTLGLYDDD